MYKNFTITNLIKLVCTLAIFSQVTHAKEVYYLLSHESDTIINEIFSYIFAISLELSILIFTLNGMVTKARFFATISILINIIYYYYTIELTQKFLGSMIISVIIPITILFYSDLFNNDATDVEDIEQIDMIDIIAEDYYTSDATEIPNVPQDIVKRPVGRPRKIVTNS